MSVTSSPRPTRSRGVAATVAVATLIALVAALIVYAVARLTGADLVVAPPGQPAAAVNAVSVVMITAVSGLGALVLALVLARVVPRRARIVFLVLALIVLAVSMFGPLGAAQQTSTAVWLSIMHVVVATAIITLTLRALPGPSGAQAARR